MVSGHAHTCAFVASSLVLCQFSQSHAVSSTFFQEEMGRMERESLKTSLCCCTSASCCSHKSVAQSSWLPVAGFSSATSMRFTSQDTWRVCWLFIYRHSFQGLGLSIIKKNSLESFVHVFRSMFMINKWNAQIPHPPPPKKGKKRNRQNKRELRGKFSVCPQICDIILSVRFTKVRIPVK